MHCAYVQRTDTSASSTRVWMFGMMYSGKIEAFDGVITVTNINYKDAHVE